MEVPSDWEMEVEEVVAGLEGVLVAVTDLLMIGSR